MKKEPTSLKTLVAYRLARLERSPAEASRIGNLEGNFIRDILRGKKKSIGSESLPKLAQALDCSISDLMPYTGTAATNAEPSIPVIGSIAAGIWIDVTTETIDQEAQLESPFPADPKYPIAAQFDYLVEGDSINNFAKHGQRIRCVSIDSYGDPEFNDIVIVERLRGDLRERTAKRYRRNASGQEELWPDSDNPKWQQPIKLGEDPESDLTKIIAVVLWMYAQPRPWKKTISRTFSK